MKQQSTAFLLCALVLSTLAHEHLKSKHHRSHALKHHQKKSHLLSRLQSRADEQSCHQLCVEQPHSGDGSVSLNITIQESLIVGFNTDVEVAFVIDINAQLAGLFNGTGEVVILNIQTQEIVHLAAGACSLSWDSSKTSAADFFFAADFSLSAVWQSGSQNGQTTTVQEASKEVIAIVANFLINLSTQYAASLSSASAEAVSIFFNLAVKAVSNAKVFQLFVAAGAVVGGGIEVFVGIAEGINQSVSALGLSIEEIIEAKIKFELAILQNLAGGIQRLTYIIGAISAHIDVSGAIKQLTQSAQAFFNFAASISGEVDVSVVFYYILRAIDNAEDSNALNDLIDILIQFSTSASSTIQASLHQFQDSIKVFVSIAAQFGISASFLDEIASGNWEVNGVNLSAILSALAHAGGDAAFAMVVQVLSLLDAVISIKLAIVGLFLRVAVLIASGGAEIAFKLIPALQQCASNMASTIAGIVTQLPKLAVTLATKGLYDALSTIQVFAAVFQAIEDAAASVHVSIDIKADFDGLNALSALHQLEAAISAAISGSGGFTIGVGGAIEGSGGSSGNGTVGAETGGSSDGSGSGTVVGETGGSSDGSGTTDENGWGSGTVSGEIGGPSDGSGSGSEEGGTGGSSDGSGSGSVEEETGGDGSESGAGGDETGGSHGGSVDGSGSATIGEGASGSGGEGASVGSGGVSIGGGSSGSGGGSIGGGDIGSGSGSSSTGGGLSGSLNPAGGSISVGGSGGTSGGSGGTSGGSISVGSSGGGGARGYGGYRSHGKQHSNRHHHVNAKHIVKKHDLHKKHHQRVHHKERKHHQA